VVLARSKGVGTFAAGDEDGLESSSEGEWWKLGMLRAFEIPDNFLMCTFSCNSWPAA
jgi:hypothetical protein